jgi:hypothetical protein
MLMRLLKKGHRSASEKLARVMCWVARLGSWLQLSLSSRNNRGPRDGQMIRRVFIYPDSLTWSQSEGVRCSPGDPVLEQQ